MSDSKKLLISSVGIFITYFAFGILQEKITRGRYGEEENDDGTTGERFTFTLALVGVQCACNWIFAKAILMSRPQAKDNTNPMYYFCSSLTYLLAMVSSNMALRWVAYPTQVIAKSAKPIPVMLLGVLIGRKTYSFKKYVFVFLIVVGVALFMYKEGKVNKSAESSGLGELLLFLSLSMDGLTGAIQERMRASTAPSGQYMMLSMNQWSTVMVTGALIISGEGKDFINFTMRHPVLIEHLALLALCGALGQMFIFMMVSHFGPLPCSVVTTTRKFFTVLFSVLFFGNSLAGRQWFGAVLVFTGLFADMITGKRKVVPNKEKSKDDKEHLLHAGDSKK